MCSVYTLLIVSSSQQTVLFVFYFCVFLFRTEIWMPYVMFKTYSKTSRGHQRKKIAQFSVKTSIALQIGHWKGVDGFLGHPQQVTQPPWLGSAAPAVPALDTLSRAFKLCSGSNLVWFHNINPEQPNQQIIHIQGNLDTFGEGLDIFFE